MLIFVKNTANKQNRIILAKSFAGNTYYLLSDHSWSHNYRTMNNFKGRCKLMSVQIVVTLEFYSTGPGFKSRLTNQLHEIQLFLRISSEPLGKFLDITSNWATTASFNILRNL
jgi:hypothetical protein